MIALATDIHSRLESTPWLSSVGSRDVLRLGFAFIYAAERADAETMCLSDRWSQARQSAQSDLTRYLSRHHYNEYGTHWNELSKRSRGLLENKVAPKVREALISADLSEALMPSILIDLNRAILEESFRRKFKKTPVFFERLLSLYEVGHLPCGWDGDLDRWPVGSLIVY
jgi:hypothetical protein